MEELQKKLEELVERVKELESKVASLMWERDVRRRKK